MMGKTRVSTPAGIGVITGFMRAMGDVILGVRLDNGKFVWIVETELTPVLKQVRSPKGFGPEKAPDLPAPPY
jgi:hypothetical protein